MDDILHPVQTFPVPDKVVTDQSGLSDYCIPPTGHRPQSMVVFDFLRRATTTSQELAPGAAPFSLSTASSFATERAVDRLNHFFPGFYRYAVTIGLGSDLPFLTTRPAEPPTPGGKVDFVNAVLANFLTSATVERDCQGVATMSASFVYPRPVARARQSSDRPRDAKDADPMWIHLLSSATRDWSIFDQSLIGLNTWVYVIGRCRTDPRRWVFEFTGLVNAVARNNERGFVTVSVTAQDTTKLLHKSMARMNPAIADPTAQVLGKVFGSNFSIFNNPLSGMDLEKIFRYLILGEDQTTSAAQAPLGILDYRLAEQGEIAAIYDARSIAAPPVTKDPLSDLMSLSAIARERRTNPAYSSKLVMWGVNDYVPYRAIMPTTQPSFFSSKMVNRFEACKEAAHRCMIEFYAGSDGNYYVHPYRHALKFLTAHTVLGGLPAIEMATRWDGTRKSTDAYVIEEDEILSDTEGLSDDEIVTLLVLTGESPFIGPSEADWFARRVAVPAPDYMLGRFGFWYREIVEPLINTTDPDTLKMYALARLAFINKEAYSMQVTVPFRPEIQEARPVYFPSRGNVGYVMNITHAFTARQQCVTRLSVGFLRKAGAPTVDFTEYLVQRGLTSPPLDPASIRTMVGDFLKAAGYGAGIEPVLFSAQRPGSATGTPTSTELNRRAAEQSDLQNLQDYVNRLVEQASTKPVVDAVLSDG